MDGANRLILTPCAETRLVAREALAALEKQGWHVAAWAEGDLTPQRLARLFALPPERSGLPAHPSLFFSINFHGLDKFGENFAVLKGKGVPVAVWCVDNPWNLLSGLRDGFWKETQLFVTDPSFIPDLKAHGAKHVTFLPLATDPAIFQPRQRKPDAATPQLVFVGRSVFPDKERFFVGQNLPEATREKALTIIKDGGRPDFAWWLRELGLESPGAVLWPGSSARGASLGAEEVSLAWRSACLREAARMGLAVYGDAAWKEHFPEGAGESPILYGPVDYYNDLPALYATAPFSLNMMHFLLPRGLNQRHFDVWAAGGFCLMDDCPGLELFPPELTAPVTFKKLEGIAVLAERFSKALRDKESLAASWRKHILAEHTYERRIRLLAKSIFA